jgi:hypothetical protein
MARGTIITGFLIWIFLNLLIPEASAQRLVFEDSTFTSSDYLKYGPNLTHYSHPFFRSSAIFSLFEGASALTKQPFTGQLSFGYRYKYKLTKKISLIFDSGIDRSFFQLNDTKGLLNTDTIQHFSQTIQTFNLFGSALIRLRFGQGGNYIGQYLDFGFMGQSYLSNTLITKNQLTSGKYNPWTSDLTTRTKLKILEPFSYSACIKLGFNRISLLANYRLSQLLKSTIGRDLPNFLLGMEISIISY